MKRLAFVLLFLAACGKDSTAPISSPVGTWNLATIDGKALPANILAPANGLCGLDVMSASYFLSSAGAYTAQTHYGTVVGGTIYCDASSSESGSYAVQGSTVQLHAGNFSHSLTLTPTGLSATLEGHEYAYRK